ncbi:nucleosome assembly protein 1;2-like [Drosophila eugracilis]|uniref:nucleosome assembly protein 1;2-like n=1 Tax=Drosophila eugracilis TaxID=29029 RepID=UPI0007E71A6F|nr:nucleosome assembly protein 1;2-like [Drosophila eugracilis]
MSDTGIGGALLASGLTFLLNRICVRNLPVCTRHELAAICLPYGEIRGSLVCDDIGFVQFASEAQAENAIEALDGSVFKSKVLAVSNACFDGEVSGEEDLDEEFDFDFETDSDDEIEDDDDDDEEEQMAEDAA